MSSAVGVDVIVWGDSAVVWLHCCGGSTTVVGFVALVVWQYDAVKFRVMQRLVEKCSQILAQWCVAVI